ncbi:MAG: 4-(cytidine 5'-diphospho)-2-C-methyl-D-erythritol kinase [Chloroherpetonaceae bacterium]|nr:4-(cytidine 5'-diphospho)-2-C-methyl-D-erythritol kinase [Chloroherpetonaceae bacterium]
MTRQMSRLVEKAYAKINLALYITDRLPNGYHTLETIFLPIAWHDTLTFEPAETLTLSCNKPELPTGEENLCMKAARVLQKMMSVQKGCHIHLHKEVPHGAGLGGGSSDAAATLRALNQLWDLELPAQKLKEIAITLGADVPYFLASPKAMRGQGIGEKLEPLDNQFPFAVLVVFPKVLVPTAWAYQSLKLEFPKPAHDTKRLFQTLCERKLTNNFQHFANDFEPSVIAAYPEIGMIKKKMKELGAAHTMMSGSGSAVFGVFERNEDAEKAALQFAGQFPLSVTPREFYNQLNPV